MANSDRKLEESELREIIYRSASRFVEGYVDQAEYAVTLASVMIESFDIIVKNEK